MEQTTNFRKLAIALIVTILFSASCTKQIDRFADAVSKIDKFEVKPVSTSDVSNASRKPPSYVGTSTIGDTLAAKAY